MALDNSINTVAPNGPIATASPNGTDKSKPKISLTRKRKADETVVNQNPIPESDGAQKDLSAPAEAEKPLKKVRLLRPKPTSDTVVNESRVNEVKGMGMFDSAPPNLRRKRNQKKAASAVQQLQATSEIVAATHVEKGGSPVETGISEEPARKSSEPKTLKPTQQDAVNAEVPNGNDAPTITGTSVKPSKKRKLDASNMETRGSDLESNSSPEKKPKRVSQRPKKASARKLEADASAMEKKVVPPAPLPPTVIRKEVANKVKHVRDYIDNEDEQNSKLDRDLENRHLISVPETSLVSAVIRMRAHYEINLTQEEALAGVENAIVRRFKQNIGPEPNIDWVTIDALKRTSFEDRILEKIARHGLDDVNLLEIELEMFKKDHLKRLGLYDDAKEVVWDADRFLRVFEQIWNGITCEDEPLDLMNGHESDNIETPDSRTENEDVGLDHVAAEEKSTTLINEGAPKSTEEPTNLIKKDEDKISDPEQRTDLNKKEYLGRIDTPAPQTGKDDDKNNDLDHQRESGNEEDSEHVGVPVSEARGNGIGSINSSGVPMQPA